jgi:DNA-binding transcriptional LysR family regulator
LLLEALLGESIEFFVSHIHNFSQLTSISVEPIGNLKLGFFVRKTHPLLKLRSIDLDQLYEYPLASHTRDESRSDYKQVMQSILGDWPGLLTCENILVLKSAALNSDAILMTAWALVEREVESGELLPLPTEHLGLSPSSNLGVIRLAGRSLSPLAGHVVAAIKSHLSTLER